MIILFRLTLLSLFISVLSLQSAVAFSFSEDEQLEKSGSTGPAISLETLKCPPSLKNKKIATMIGESHRDGRAGYNRFFVYWNTSANSNWDNRFGTTKAVYGSLIDNLNNSFHQLGLKTFTAQEINDQIATEEQEAFLNNDLDAALSAADRLGADYMLKGTISTLVQTNKVVRIEEVFVTINLSLSDKNGRAISSARISETTFSDADVPATIQRLIAENSNKISYDLFSKVCKGGN